jgi:hypothetical protein
VEAGEAAKLEHPEPVVDQVVVVLTRVVLRHQVVAVQEQQAKVIMVAVELTEVVVVLVVVEVLGLLDQMPQQPHIQMVPLAGLDYLAVLQEQQHITLAVAAEEVLVKLVLTLAVTEALVVQVVAAVVVLG